MKKIQSYWNKHLVLLQFINLYFWKSSAWVISFILVPVFSLLIMFMSSNLLTTIMPNIIIWSFCMPLSTFAIIMVNLKKSSIIEKIFIFSKKPIYSNVIIACMFFLLTLLGFIWNLFILYLVSLGVYPELFIYVDWGSMIFVALLSSFLTIAIASMFYTFISSMLKVMTICSIFMFFCIFFSGMFTFTDNNNVNTTFNYISYFSPFRYIKWLLYVAINQYQSIDPKSASNIEYLHQPLNHSIFDFSDLDDADLHSYDMALNIFVPLILTIVFLSISLNSRIGKRK